MTNFAAECFDAGLFTILSVILKQNAPGYESFKGRSIDSLEKLGFTRKAISSLALFETNKQATKIRDGLRDEIPRLIEKSLGDMGRAYYEVGFEYGVLFLALMSDQEEIIANSVHDIKYKVAAVKNPQPLLEFINGAERKVKAGKKLDISKLASFAEEFHLWIVANVNIEMKKSLGEVIIATSLAELPYFGKVLKEVYGHIREEKDAQSKKPWWKLW
jgi:hypothetical protein